jgi:polyhydroxybutyrate depolymerase
MCMIAALRGCMKLHRFVCMAIVLTLCATAPVARAQDNAIKTEPFHGRDMLVYAPKALPPHGTRALVIVLHGGLGNASRIAGATAESGLNMNAVATQDGFVVAYLNGTPVTRMMGAKFLGWNAGGGCCGVPAQTNVDDVAYIAAAVKRLVAEYAIDPAQVYGIGHSNGAIMTLRMMCETTVFAAGISVSGPLNVITQSCPASRGKRILSIHGADDRNVPIAGGRGTQGMANIAFQPESYTQKIFTASGADYRLEVVPGADHNLDAIDRKLKQAEGTSLAVKAARFFGLEQK